MIHAKKTKNVFAIFCLTGLASLKIFDIPGMKFILKNFRQKVLTLSSRRLAGKNYRLPREGQEIKKMDMSISMETFG